MNPLSTATTSAKEVLMASTANEGYAVVHKHKVAARKKKVLAAACTGVVVVTALVGSYTGSNMAPPTAAAPTTIPVTPETTIWNIVPVYATRAQLSADADADTTVDPTHLVHSATLKQIASASLDGTKHFDINVINIQDNATPATALPTSALTRFGVTPTPGTYLLAGVTPAQAMSDVTYHFSFDTPQSWNGAEFSHIVCPAGEEHCVLNGVHNGSAGGQRKLDDRPGDHDNGPGDHRHCSGFMSCWSFHISGLGCFPTVAVVNTPGGPQAMGTLTVGDLVETSVGFQPVYMLGHQDASARTAMASFRTASGHTITTSYDHYIIVNNNTTKLAKNVGVGDELLVSTDGSFVPSPIVAVSRDLHQGLFNPYTLNGDIVVNGVLVDDDSAWFLEGTSLPESAIPAVYHHLLAPVRALYSAHPGWLKRFGRQYANSTMALSEDGVAGIAAKALASYRDL
jgi:hypothetical protein